MTLRTALLAAGLVGVIGLSVSAAHASSLGVTATPLTTRTVAACSGATIAVTETPAGILGAIFGYTGVSLTVPSGCAGADLQLTVHGTNGAVQATAAAADVSAGPLSLSTSATYGGILRPAYAVAITMDGWSVPAAT